MAKAISKHEYAGKRTDAAVDAYVAEKSKNGHVWFARGVFGLVTVYEFKNVSSIPDEFVGRIPRPLLWKGGKRVEFSAAQKRREEQRGIFNDR